MGRNNNYRNSRNGNGNSWGRNSNYRNNSNSGFQGSRYNDRDDDRYEGRRSGYGGSAQTGDSREYGGNHYGGRSYGNYGSGYGGGHMEHSGRGWNSGNSYSNLYDSGYNPRSNYGHSRGSRRYEDDRNFFERAGERIRDTWNDWTGNDHDDHNSGYHSRGYRGSHYDRHDDDRNFFERAGERLREKWNDWTGNDHDDDRSYRRGNSYHEQNNGGHHAYDHGQTTGGYGRYGSSRYGSSSRMQHNDEDNYGSNWAGRSNLRSYRQRRNDYSY